MFLPGNGLDERRMMLEKRAHCRLIAAPIREAQLLEWAGEAEHRLERLVLLELRRHLERRATVADRPRIDVRAARWLRGVAPLPCLALEQLGIAREHRANAIHESERGGEKDVGGCAALDEVARELVASGAAGALEHPLGGRRAVIDISCIDIRAGGEEEVDRGARLREVKRRLPIAAALVHARRVRGDDPHQQLRTIEMRCGARIGNRAARDQTLGGIASGHVKRMKAAGPPRAALIRVRAEVEEYVDHVAIARVGDDGRRVVAEHGLVDLRAQFRVLREEPAQRVRIAAPECFVHALEGRTRLLRSLVHVVLERRPARETVFAREGWGVRLLDEQRADGQWGDGSSTPFWWSNMYTLVYLRDMGLDPASERARHAIDLVRDNVTWGPEFGDSPFFEGEVEPCINGRVVALGAYFGVRSDRLVDRLLGEQLADGGWNCEAERGSVRSSFHTTICVLEGLLAYEQAAGATPLVSGARSRAHEYLLERRLLRRLSTGDIIEPAWTRFAFPTLWHYDVLRALDYLRASNVQPDDRMNEAEAIVLERRQGDNRWLLDLRHRDTLYSELSGAVGAPNRWVTLRATRVLEWCGRASR
jgi:hypothetical protein